jgi:hypothetical protein
LAKLSSTKAVVALGSISSRRPRESDVAEASRLDVPVAPACPIRAVRRRVRVGASAGGIEELRAGRVRGPGSARRLRPDPIFQREHQQFGKAEYARLGEISVAHLYNLRGSAVAVLDADPQHRLVFTRIDLGSRLDRQIPGNKPTCRFESCQLQDYATSSSRMRSPRSPFRMGSYRDKT